MAANPIRPLMVDPNEPGCVITESRLRAWWLETFKGYRLRNVNQEPKMGSFGRISYQRRYVLLPPPGK